MNSDHSQFILPHL